jgi:DNA-binding NtrC family response regulator
MYETKLDRLLQLVERKLILKAIRDNHGHRSAAARQLGISRSRLYRRLTQLGIQLDGAAEPGSTQRGEMTLSAAP